MKLRGQGQQAGRLLVGVGAAAGELQLAGEARQSVDQRPDREASLLLGDLERLLGELAADPVLGQHLLDFRGVMDEIGGHRLAHQGDEAIPAGVVFLHQRFIVRRILAGDSWRLAACLRLNSVTPMPLQTI
jgi:hypothetical protein